MNKIIQYSFGQNQEIDEKIIYICGNHEYSTIFHEPDWNNITSKYFNTEFYYWLFYEKDDLIGICPVHKKGNDFYNAPREFNVVYGGWLFNQEEKQKKRGKE